MVDKSEEKMNILMSKAADADKSEDAQRFTQAACNIANAIRTMVDTKAIVKDLE